MIDELVHSWSLAVVVLETCVEERKTHKREFACFREVIGTSGDIFEKVLLTSARERCVACKHLVKDAAE